jgi:hypothetical protein
MVGDLGTYEPIEGSYYKGKLRIFLEGRKLKGEWELVRAPGEDRRKWFLTRVSEAAEPRGAQEEDASAVTGRTMGEIARARDSVWHSNRTDILGLDLDRLPPSDLKFVEPMQPKLVSKLPEVAGWEYEIFLLI